MPDTKLEFSSSCVAAVWNCGRRGLFSYDYFSRIISARLFPRDRQRQNSLDHSLIAGFGVELGFPSLVEIPSKEQPELMDYKLPHMHM